MFGHIGKKLNKKIFDKTIRYNNFKFYKQQVTIIRNATDKIPPNQNTALHNSAKKINSVIVPMLGIKHCNKLYVF